MMNNAARSIRLLKSNISTTASGKCANTFVSQLKVKATRRGMASSSGRASSGIDVVSPVIGLTPEQAEFYNLARSFADSEMKPFASKWDEASHMDMPMLRKSAGLGFGGIYVKDDVGGSGLTRLDCNVIVEALATGCVGHTAMLTIHNMCAGMIDKFGSEEARQRFLPDMTSLNKMASYCLTEPSSGSDASGLLTKAEFQGDHFVVNGGKAFISGAGVSDYYLVMCRTDPDKSAASGISCLILTKDMPGISFGANENKMGWKCQPTRQVMFDNVKVPIGNLLGTRGHGFKMAMSGLDGGRLNIGACSLGAAQACFELAVAYVKERKQFGKPIGQNQAIQFKLADMAGKLVTMRLVLRQAATMLDQGHPAATSHCALAKKISTEYGSEICDAALQLHGGYGYLKDYHVERYLRDCRVHQILEGTNEIMRHIVGRSIVS